MPTYQYVCRQCGTVFDVTDSVREYERKKREHDVKCESCGSPEVAIQIAEFQVQTTRKSA